MHLLIRSLVLAFVSVVAMRAADFDGVVFGGTSAGIMSAVAAGRNGASGVLLEPSDLIGGRMSGGLQIDTARWL